jgi:hypothetical protein
MARNRDVISMILVFAAAGSLGYGVWGLGGSSEVRALYWLVAGGLALKAANDRERFVASR